MLSYRPLMPDDFFFIDANRAYRGPVNRGTLQHLFHTQAITTATYIFSEGLAECDNSWVRLKRLPLLLEELQRPMAGDAPSAATTASSTAAPLTTAAPTAGGASAASSAAPASAPTPAPDTVPRTSTNPTAQGAGAPVGAAAATVLQPAARAAPARERLSGYFPAPTQATAAQPRPSTGHSGPFRFFGSRSKGAAASKGGFGQPLHLCTLGEDGVPEVLAKLRTMLFAQNGHLVEGIFRVSPSSSALKAARHDAETNHLEKIRDPECVAQLIKLWFRTRTTPPSRRTQHPHPRRPFPSDRSFAIACAGGLPESVLAPCLEPVVDGPPEDGERCSAVVAKLPEPQQSTVRWMLQLFRDVAQHEDENRMTIKSLSVVFAPNLVDPPPTMPPMLALELNGRVVTFLERLNEHERRAVEVS